MDQNPGKLPFCIRLWIVMLVVPGLGALGGGGALLFAPDGSLLQIPVSLLTHTPSSDY